MNRLSAHYIARFPVGSAIFAALLAFVIYFLTADSAVSYWDCPEYVLTASTLQVGHPPGNPIWTLAMRVATIPFPPHMHARVINICSALLMALAVFLLARICYRWLMEVTGALTSLRIHLSRRERILCSATAATFASLSFAVLDSTWFSAVEAEVYAFSTMLTALTIWLMLRWARAKSRPRRDRLLILTAYLLGLSLGVHQLNLLVLPVLALIMVYNHNPGRVSQAKFWAVLALSFLLVALILLGLMPGSVSWAALLEYFCVNRLGWPYYSGVAAYILLMAAVCVAAIRFIPTASVVWRNILLQLVIWLSGIFLFRDNLLLSLFLSIAAAGVLSAIWSRRRLFMAAFMLAMLWIGYSAVALIMIRGYASPPVNEGAPADIFSLQRYIAREQYGSRPLFYGPTPFSRPMLEERITPHSPVADYSRYVLERESPRFAPILSDPRLIYRSRLLSHEDSAANDKVCALNRGYLLTDYRFSRLMTPELNMFFPRITSSVPTMFDAYEDWAGMTRDNMERVAITTAIDSLGNPVGKLSLSGERENETALRPTYLQNFRYFLSYQLGYMYLRYLMWNFVGRQNDIPSTGEIDHGNVITGITPVDTWMVGDQSLMPSSASFGNPGRHAYYCLPLLLGIAGIILLLRSGRRGRRVATIITFLFLMTGAAIVVYLNQTPGEPRERDYAFIGSYMAFCIWIAFGFLSLGLIIKRCCKAKPLPFATVALSGLSLFLLLTAENLPDHNRSGRYHTRAFALNTLAGKDRDIIFTYGDNFTFPLWYVSEVEKAAPGATIVDMSYLSTPEYVVNLLKQGDKGIKLTATPSDIAFGAYAFTRVAADADTTPRPLLDILKELYADKIGNPTIRHTRALIPGATMADTVTLNLKSLATTSGMIPFRTLMLLDILATNLSQPSPRPLSFLLSVKQDALAPVKGLTIPEAFSDTYAPAMPREEYIRRLLTAARAVDSTSRVHPGKHIYIDPVIADQVRRQRGGVVRAAKQLLESERHSEADKLLCQFPNLFCHTTPGSFTVADSTFHETLEASKLLLQRGNPQYAEMAKKLLYRSKHEPEVWKRYYLSLPAWRRPTLSNSSRRLISTSRQIDSLLNVAQEGSPKPLPRLKPH